MGDILFKNLPGGSGEIGAILDSEELAISVGICVAGGAETFGLTCLASILISLFELAFDLFFGNLFSGRAKVGKDSATDDSALYLMESSNPVVKQWGMMIRVLEAKGYPTSVSAGPGRTAYDELTQAAHADLIKQFDGVGTPTQTFLGVPVTGTKVWRWYNYLALGVQHPDSDRLAELRREEIDHLYDYLVDSGYINPQTGFPKQYVPPPPVKPPPPPVIPPTPPVPPAKGDPALECCEQTLATLQQVEATIVSLLTWQAQNPCCGEVIVAIGGVAEALAQILQQLPSLEPTPPNLDPIQVALLQVNQTLRSISSGPGGAVNVHITNTTPLATASAIAQPPNLAPLAAAIAAVVEQLDVAPAILEYLESQGYITSSDLQAIDSASFGNSLVTIFRTAGWNALLWVASWVGATWNGKKFTFAPLGATITADVDSAVSGALRAGAAPLFPVIKGLISAIVATLKPGKSRTLGDSGVDTDELLSKTLAPALVVNGVMLLFSYLGWDSGEELAEYVNIISELVGLEEIKEIQVGQLMRAGPIAAARLQAQAQFQQSVPGAGESASFAARGLITQAAAAALMLFNGFNAANQATIQEAAYSGIQPRQLMRLMNTGLFAPADLTDEMTFAGLRGRSQARYQHAAPYLATVTERTQLRSELELAYAAGLLSDTDLTYGIESAEANVERDNLVLTKVHLNVAIQIVKALEAEYTTQFKAGLVPQAVYEANINGMGLQPWKVANLLAVAEGNMAATLQRELTAAERTLARQTVAKERQVAMKAYAAGNSSAVTLTATLINTGLTPTQVAAWVELAVLQKAGNLRWIYGVQLNPAAATILKQRVTAITDQLKSKLITGAQFNTELQKLGIGATWRNALQAAAEASAATKPGVTPAIPVQT